MSGSVLRRLLFAIQISVAPLKSSIEMIGSIPEDDSQSLSSVQQIDAICDQFELAWFRGERLSIEKIIADSPATLRDAVARELIAIEMEMRAKAGEKLDLAEYSKYMPELSFTENPSTVDDKRTATSPITPPPKRIRYFGDYRSRRSISNE